MKNLPVVSLVLAILVAFVFVQSNAQLYGPKRQSNVESGSAGQGNVDNGKAAEAKCEGEDCKGGGKGDPVFTAFDGREFEFHGQPGHFYNLVSEKGAFQLSTLLKPASMFNHNGTYLKGVGFKYRNVEVVVEAGPDFDTSLTVEANRQLLDLGEDNMLNTTFVADDGSELKLLWEMYRSDLGPVVEIQSRAANVRVLLTAPEPDQGGMMQPNYLNVNITLVASPAGELHGVIGDSYNHVSHLPLHEYMTAKSSGLLSVRPTITYPLLPDSSYEIEGYFTSPIRQIMAQLLKRLHLKAPKNVLSR